MPVAAVGLWRRFTGAGGPSDVVDVACRLSLNTIALKTVHKLDILDFLTY